MSNRIQILFDICFLLDQIFAFFLPQKGKMPNFLHAFVKKIKLL